MTESLKRWEFDYEGSYFLDDEGEWVRYDDANKRIRELADGLDAAIEINNAHVERELGYQHRIRELEGFCKAVIRYAGNTGDDYLSNKARELLESER